MSSWIIQRQDFDVIFPMFLRFLSSVFQRFCSLRLSLFVVLIRANSESFFPHHLSPILGIAIVKIPAETLKQKTILFKLMDGCS
jgi:hypothetical protein